MRSHLMPKLYYTVLYKVPESRIIVQYAIMLKHCTALEEASVALVLLFERVVGLDVVDELVVMLAARRAPLRRRLHELADDLRAPFESITQYEYHLLRFILIVCVCVCE